MQRLSKTAATTALLLMAGAASAQTTLFYSEGGPNRGVRAEATKWLVDEVARQSDGDLLIDVNWGGALFSDKVAIQSIRDGVADMGTVIGAYFPQDMIAYGLADLPLPNSDPWVGMRAIDEIMRSDETIVQNLAAQNLVYVGTFTTSPVQVGCKGKAIKSLDDLPGVKVRGVGAYGKMFHDLGATPVDMSVYEAYQGLETGVIDCTQTYTYLIESLKFNEVLDSFTEVDFGQIGSLGVLMNKQTYDSLSPGQQDALMAAGKGLADHYGRLVEAANERSLQILVDQGTPIYKLSDEDKTRFAATGAPYVNEWIARADAAGLNGQALVDRYIELIGVYAKQRDEQGYPWNPR